MLSCVLVTLNICIYENDQPAYCTSYVVGPLYSYIMLIFGLQSFFSIFNSNFIKLFPRFFFCFCLSFCSFTYLKVIYFEVRNRDIID